MPLSTSSNFARPDDAFRAIVEAHRGLTDEQSADLDAALVLILAGALFSKIVGAYSSLDEFLRVFSWPYGQLANFATLTRFLHEAWPFAAVAYLVALFLHGRRKVE